MSAFVFRVDASPHCLLHLAVDLGDCPDIHTFRGLQSYSGGQVDVGAQPISAEA